MATIIENDAYEVILGYHKRVASAIAKIKEKVSPLTLEWIDGAIVCEALKISPRTLKWYRESGKLQCSFLGSKYYYRVETIRKMLSDNLTKTKKQNG